MPDADVPDRRSFDDEHIPLNQRRQLALQYIAASASHDPFVSTDVIKRAVDLIETAFDADTIDYNVHLTQSTEHGSECTVTRNGVTLFHGVDLATAMLRHTRQSDTASGA